VETRSLDVDEMAQDPQPEPDRERAPVEREAPQAKAAPTPPPRQSGNGNGNGGFGAGRPSQAVVARIAAAEELRGDQAVVDLRERHGLPVTGDLSDQPRAAVLAYLGDLA
jgi:hypothetical protein